ncbi:MAG: hypothetical protein H6926_10015 [Chromatiales bacterium]|nr:hypothetical protein [Chromatiales bacterium]
MEGILKKLQSTVMWAAIALIITITIFAAFAIIFGSPKQSVGAEVLLEWASEILKFIVLAALVGGVGMLSK